ncbi:ribonuclease P protein component 4 [Methanolobus bombayensis]|uniref:ribonuclease P protein component 4 n=1 Tax=Methanolobus bombayensis TaxID=38023 RepID=UPI001AE90557|nr:ribonuclease P protein component 4 [Methanolobus bombayensis]MBP1910058.1 ribonuclease P protein subunit RPR2 [Methanolobus bombayensis]
MARSRKKNKAVARSIAQDRIEYLFDLAKSEFLINPDKSKRYVALARKIGMRHRVGIPSELKRRFCKNCGSLLVPGNNSRVRLQDEIIIITCLDCGDIERYPFGKEKKN